MYLVIIILGFVMEIMLKEGTQLVILKTYRTENRCLVTRAVKEENSFFIIVLA
jgi:hypothetical protein